MKSRVRNEEMRNEDACSERIRNVQGYPAGPGTLRLLLQTPSLFCSVPWEAGLYRELLLSLHPLTFRWVGTLQGSSRGGRKERLEWLGPALFLWGHSSAEVVRTLFQLQLFLSASHSLSSPRPGGGGNTDSFPLLLVSGSFPTLRWSCDPLHIPANSPFIGHPPAPSGRAQCSSSRSSLTGKANAKELGFEHQSA